MTRSGRGCGAPKGRAPRRLHKEEEKTVRRIVVMKHSDALTACDDVIASLGGCVKKRWSLVNAVAVEWPKGKEAEALRSLAHRDDVLRVEEDSEITMLDWEPGCRQGRRRIRRISGGAGRSLRPADMKGQPVEPPKQGGEAPQPPRQGIRWGLPLFGLPGFRAGSPFVGFPAPGAGAPPALPPHSPARGGVPEAGRPAAPRPFFGGPGFAPRLGRIVPGPAFGWPGAATPVGPFPGFGGPGFARPAPGEMSCGDMAVKSGSAEQPATPAPWPWAPWAAPADWWLPAPWFPGGAAPKFGGVRRPWGGARSPQKEGSNQSSVMSKLMDLLKSLLGARKDDKALEAETETVPWSISMIGADKVPAAGKGVKVAILDTGIDSTHPDLRGAVKGGYNAVGNSRSVRDRNGHGTHVAGIIASRKNRLGIRGIAPEVDLYAVKVLDDRGSGKVSDLIEGIEWAVQNKMDIINMSVGTRENNQTLREAVENAARAGVIMVAAAGNNGPSPNTVLYPAKYPEVISVGAVSKDRKIADFSARGAEVDVVAPGKDIYSTWPGGGYRTLSGTSMAAPHVTGVVAQLLSAGAVKSASSIRSYIDSTAERLPGASRSEQGAGLINAERAYSRVKEKKS